MVQRFTLSQNRLHKAPNNKCAKQTRILGLSVGVLVGSSSVKFSKVSQIPNEIRLLPVQSRPRFVPGKHADRHSGVPFNAWYIFVCCKKVRHAATERQSLSIELLVKRLLLS